MITADDIAHSPAQTLQEIIAQTPGVQLTSLFGGVNGAKTSVDLRGFGAFATSNTLVLVNGRRLNDIDIAGVDFSTIPRDSIERIEITRGNSGAVLYGYNAVGELINALDRSVPGVRDRLLESATRLRPHINVFVDGQPADLTTAVGAAAVVHVLPAVSGG